MLPHTAVRPQRPGGGRGDGIGRNARLGSNHEGKDQLGPFNGYSFSLVGVWELLGTIYLLHPLIPRQYTTIHRTMEQR